MKTALPQHGLCLLATLQVLQNAYHLFARQMNFKTRRDGIKTIAFLRNLGVPTHSNTPKMTILLAPGGSFGQTYCTVLEL